jgi:hypothetical protein
MKGTQKKKEKKREIIIKWHLFSQRVNDVFYIYKSLIFIKD